MNVRRLFVASCLSLLTTSMVFAIRGDIEGALSGAFHLTKEQVGLIWGPAFWGFTLAIFVSGTIVDAVGMRFLHVLSSLGYIGGILLVLFAPRPDGPVPSIFGSTGTTLLYVGFLAMGLSQGLVEGVINPLVATLFKEEKTHKLNVLHAWWPGGMIVGGVTAYVLTQFGASWQVKLAAILVPAVAYLLMILGQEYPKTERVQSNVSTGDMFKEAFNPMFLLLFACMWMTAASELGPDQWFPSIMKDLTGIEGVLFLVYTAGLMFVLRFFFGGLAHKLSPFGLMMGCSILCALGLYWLGGLQPGTSPVVAFVAATLFGVGKTYYWPTMLGVTSELFPKGGALLMALMGGAGMLCIAVVLPIMGAAFDKAGAGAALRTVAILPVILTVVFGLLFAYYKARGGYRAVRLEDLEGVMRVPLVIGLLAPAVVAGAVVPFLQAAQAKSPKKVLVVTVTKGFRHDSIPTAERLIDQLAKDSGAFVVDYARTDADLTTKMGVRVLAGHDGVVFASTTGDLPLPDRQAFVDWVAAGHGFVGIHSATDTYHGWAPFIEMIGGEFESHGPQAKVDLLSQDPAHPATKGMASPTPVFDEIYLYKSFSRDRVHMLLALDKHPNEGTPGYYPLAWTRAPGKGRVFYTALGHREDVLEAEWYRKHLLGGILWALGLAS